MKRAFHYLIPAIILAVVAVVFAACYIPTAPEEVQIKASPTYDVPAGSTKVNIQDYIDLDEALVSQLDDFFGEGSSSGEVRDGTYTIDTSYKPISLNTADFFEEEIDLTGELSQTIDPINFSVPSVGTEPVNASYDLPAGGPYSAGEVDSGQDTTSVPLDAPDNFVSATIGSGT
ncbi:MAG: hypothetical protein ACLFQW_12405, partial [Spirochaetaceae bacterium]